MKKIYYLGYYNAESNKSENRNIVLSATNKMTYIVEAIEKAGHSVEVVSASQTLNKRSYGEKIVPICENSQTRLFKTIPWGNKLRRVASIFYSRRQYKRYILKNLTKDDTLIVYHSVAYADFIAKAKKKIGFKLILEVEEIYADVNGRERDRIKEYKAFESADAYIFPTELLNEKLNTNNKPYAIIYGTYHVEKDRNVHFDDGKIHVVYAGTFDPRKGGGAVVAVSEFLDERYHIHVLGFGSAADKAHLISEIERASQKTKCRISYDGLLSGEAYIKFIQKCDIGMSPQNPTATFNNTSFPSKVLSYMSNGLRVISIRISSIEKSAIGEYMFFYDEQRPEKIADAIRAVDLSAEYDSRNIISELDKEFVRDLKEMLGE